MAYRVNIVKRCKVVEGSNAFLTKAGKDGIRIWVARRLLHSASLSSRLNKVVHIPGNSSTYYTCLQEIRLYPMI